MIGIFISIPTLFLLPIVECRFYRTLPFSRVYRHTLEKLESPATRNGPEMIVLENNRMASPSINKALANHHFIAIRPDYAFLNVANVIKSLFDKRN